MHIQTHGPQETFDLGKRIGGSLKAGDVVAMWGDLGAGKTVMTQGIVAGMGISARVASPTFTIMAIYPGETPVYHFDFYRLNGADSLYEIGLDEYFDADGVCVIEWPGQVDDALPARRVDITIKLGEKEDEREIDIVPVGGAGFKFGEEK